MTENIITDSNNEYCDAFVLVENYEADFCYYELPKTDIKFPVFFLNKTQR